MILNFPVYAISKNMNPTYPTFYVSICNLVQYISLQYFHGKFNNSDLIFSVYRGSPTSTVSTSTNSTSTIFSAIGIKSVLVEFLDLAM